MKVFTLLTALTITTIATAAQAQWIASQPSTLTVAPGARVVAPFGLIGSVNYTTGVYNVAAPIVVWQGAPPSSVSTAVSVSTVDIYSIAPYGNFVVNSPAVAVGVGFTVPSGATAGSTYQGTVYLPLAGQGISTQALVGTVLVKVN